MSFLSATLVLGTLAAVVPIVLHLLARREPKKVIFSSVQFLTVRFESNRSRMQIRRWWLLALRVLAVMALAIALARPAIHRSLSTTWLTIGIIGALCFGLLVMASVSKIQQRNRNLVRGLTLASLIAGLAALVWGTFAYASGPSVTTSDGGPIACSIIMDNSPASGWKSGEETTIGRMQQIAGELIARLPAQSRISIIDRSMTPAAFSVDIAAAVSKIDRAEPILALKPISATVETAIRLLRTSDLDNRQVVIITDLARGGWDSQRSSEEVALALDNPDQPVSVSIVDLGERVGINRSLSKLQVTNSRPAADSATTVTAIVSSNVYGDPANLLAENDGVQLQAAEVGGAESSITVELQMFDSDPTFPIIRDGVPIYSAAKALDRTTIDLRPGTNAEVVLATQGLPIGIHHGKLVLTGSDALSIDDQQYFTLVVSPPSRLLMVGDFQPTAVSLDQEGSTSPLLADQEADAIAWAANVSTDPGQSSAPEFLVEKIAEDDLQVADLSGYDVIALLDPSAEVLAPSAETDSPIENYLRQGGAIWVCLGPNLADGEGLVGVAPANPSGPANTDQASPSEESLSVPLPVVNPVRRWRVPGDGSFLRVVRPSHPLFSGLDADTPWNLFPVNQYWQLDPLPADQVIARFAGNDHPAVVIRQSQDESSGAVSRIVVIATPLPALVEPAASWNRLFKGEPWPAFVLTRQSLGWLAGRRGDPLSTMVGRPITVPLDTFRKDAETRAAQRLQLFVPGRSTTTPLETGAGASGVTIPSVEQPGIYWIKGADPNLGFSANASEETLSLGRVDPATLDQVFGTDSYRLVEDAEEIELSDRLAKQRVSLTSPAMLVAFIVFLIEQLLSNRFYQARSN